MVPSKRLSLRWSRSLVRRVGGDFDVLDYAEHAIGQGADARAVAYIETVDANGNIRWGIGTDPNITTASLRAVLAGVRTPTPSSDVLARLP